MLLQPGRMIAPPYLFIDINLSSESDNMLLLHRNQNDISRETLGMATRPSSILYNAHRRKGELQTYKLAVLKGVCQIITTNHSN